MSFVNRTIIICAIKSQNSSKKQHLCYIPELAALQFAIKRLTENQITIPLHALMQTLASYETLYGPGIVPLKYKESLPFIENLFNITLENNIPLPVNITENDLKYHVKKLEDSSNILHIHEKRVRINYHHLSFFAKYLPYVGTLMTYALTLGFTLMSYKTLLNWCWSFSLVALFCLSKLLTNYADISGGPERRLQMLGSWIDRMRTGAFTNYAKFCLPLLLVNITTITILGCSSVLTWYAAWEILCTIKAISELPSFISLIMAGAFAGFSAGSTFGRIYSDLYQLLYRKFSYFFSFDNVKEENKLDLEKLFQKLNAAPNTIANVTLSAQVSAPSEEATQAPLILHQYTHNTLAVNDEAPSAKRRNRRNSTF